MAVEFSYQYRDASNYKAGGRVVFAGEVTPALLERLRAALDEGDFFIAHQVGVPTVFLWQEGAYEVGEDDHCWHEFVGAANVEGAPTSDMTFEAFVARVERARADGWEEFTPEAGED